MLKSVVFILLCYLSSFGDAIFLSGIPVFFYQESGGSILETTYVSVAIIVTVIIARKWIVHFNKKSPLLMTAVGEVLMGCIEIVLIVLYHFTHSKWVIIVGVFPLALVYNFYVPIKFFRLQDHFFPGDTFFLTSIQSAAFKIGTLSGIFISGFIVLSYGIYGVLVIDSLSFFLFGIAMYVAYRVLKVSSMKKNEAEKPKESPISLITNNVVLVVVFISISMATLFTSWEQASAIAVASKITHFAVDKSSLMRAYIGAMGMLSSLFFVKIFSRHNLYLWFVTLFVLAIVLTVLGSVLPYFAVDLLFFFGGVLSVLVLPIQRSVYKALEVKNLNFAEVAAKHWIYNSALGLSLIPIGYFCDRITTPVFNDLQMSMMLVLFFGCVGGLVIYKRQIGSVNT